MNSVSIDVDMLDSVPAKTMLKLVEKRQSAIKFLNDAARDIQGFSSLFRFFEDQDIDLRIDPDMLHIIFSFTGTAEKLGRVWGELRRHGFNTASRPQKGDTSFNAYWGQEGHIKLFMCFSSSTCRRVKVGTKTVEQDVFETQCDSIEGIESIGHDGPPAALPAPQVEEIPF